MSGIGPEPVTPQERQLLVDQLRMERRQLQELLSQLMVATERITQLVVALIRALK